MARIPVAEGVFTWPSDEPRLIGSRCAACGIVTFPRQESCPRCASTEMAEHLLSRRGRLWAWTTQEFPPPTPPYAGPTGDAFVPYGVGYVELAGEVRVETRLTTTEGYTDKPIYLRASVVRTRRLGAFEVHSPWLPIEETAGPTVDASRAAFEKAGIGPEDVDVIQLQDTDAGAEVIHLAENGFCADGDQEALVADGELEVGGRLPVNTDGALIANGEPIGASGLRQVHEVVLQLRGQAGDRQVPGEPKVGYTQLYGAPGVAGVSILSV
jgi:uncharacterized OB-fold protein